jgi:O-acetylserine/cysteine efflux transporter
MHFGLMFLALNAASTASVSIVLQLSIPLTAILSVLILDERVSWRRAAGIALAFSGVIIVMWEPEGQSTTIGLLFAFASAAALALGSILLKRYGPIRPLRMQAWVALASFPPLTGISLFAEHGQWQGGIDAGWPFWAGLAFSVAIVTIVAHTAYFRVLQRYPASLVAPLGLMMPLMSIAMGVVLLGEAFDLHMLLGGLVALIGLLAILFGQATPPQPQEAT